MAVGAAILFISILSVVLINRSKQKQFTVKLENFLNKQ